jgi:hypothetical protein
MVGEFSNKVAVVTGGSRGIGGRWWLDRRLLLGPSRSVMIAYRSAALDDPPAHGR